MRVFMKNTSPGTEIEYILIPVLVALPVLWNHVHDWKARIGYIYIRLLIFLLAPSQECFHGKTWRWQYHRDVKNIEILVVNTQLRRWIKTVLTYNRLLAIGMIQANNFMVIILYTNYMLSLYGAPLAYCKHNDPL